MSNRKKGETRKLRGQSSFDVDNDDDYKSEARKKDPKKSKLPDYDDQDEYTHYTR